MTDSPKRDGSGTRIAGEAFFADIIVPRLEALQSGQNTMNAALGLMLDTLQVQTNLLRRLNEYAKDEPAESPVTKVLGELTSAIMELDSSIGGMEKKFDQLAGKIAAAYRTAPDADEQVPINGST